MRQLILVLAVAAVLAALTRETPVPRHRAPEQVRAGERMVAELGLGPSRDGNTLIWLHPNARSVAFIRPRLDQFGLVRYPVAERL